jgi:short-subunit dehydrogenase
MLMKKRTLLYGAAGLAAGLTARALLRRRTRFELSGRVAAITGGSRGLGLLLARQLAQEGCKIVICARDEAELNRASSDLAARGAEVLAVTCDVTDRDQVNGFLRAARERFGRVDLLVNNAGVMQVGPVETMTVPDFEQAMNVMFWGVVYPTLSVLPQMLERRSGQIVNITSIAGKISMPRLIPYNCAKFAAVGFSEGLRAEVKAKGLYVLTVAPGLMRTGSYYNAVFKGNQEKEASWFALGASLPLVSMNAERAARQIVSSIKRGESERVLTLQADLAARFHGLFPGLTTDLLSIVNRILPGGEPSPRSRRGSEVEGLNRGVMRGLTTLGRKAARRSNQPAV